MPRAQGRGTTNNRTFPSPGTRQRSGSRRGGGGCGPRRGGGRAPARLLLTPPAPWGAGCQTAPAASSPALPGPDSRSPLTAGQRGVYVPVPAPPQHGHAAPRHGRRHLPAAPPPRPLLRPAREGGRQAGGGASRRRGGAGAAEGTARPAGRG